MPHVHKPKPAYVQIADHLQAAIESGQYLPGDKVPSVREIRQQWEVAHNTAAMALAHLRRAGIVVGVPGIGTVVKDPSPQQ